LNLPYGTAAQERLALARAWNRALAVVNPRAEYHFLKVALTQWLHIIARAENLHNAQSAPHTQQVLDTLRTYGNLDHASAPIAELNRSKREMRRLLVELVGGTVPGGFAQQQQGERSSRPAGPPGTVPAGAQAVSREPGSPLPGGGVRGRGNYGSFQYRGDAGGDWACYELDRYGNRMGSWERSTRSDSNCLNGYESFLYRADSNGLRFCYRVDFAGNRLGSWDSYVTSSNCQ
jgi:hypothetical protein